MNNDYDNEWRSLYASEENILSKYFETIHKVSANWFFTIWISMGYIAIIGSIISFVSDIIKNGFNIFMLPAMILALPMVYFFFIFLGHKLRDSWSKQELNAIKNKTAAIYETCVIDKYTSKRNDKRVYKLSVKDPNDVVLCIDVNKQMYDMTKPFDPVYVFSYHEPKHPNMMHVYSDKWIHEIRKTLNI